MHNEKSTSLRKGDLNEIYDHIDSLAYALKNRCDQLENLSHRIYGPMPQSAAVVPAPPTPIITPLEEIRSRLNDCFRLLESFDHHLDTLSRL